MRFILLFFLLVTSQLFSQAEKEKKKDNVTNEKIDLTTYFEKSNYLETSDYAECIVYCKKLEQSSNLIHLTFIGKSPEGRNIPMLIIDNDGYSEAREIKQTNKIVVLIQAGIHAGEINGKDAGFLFIRDIIKKNKYKHLLENTSILFIPIYNVDGHEHFGAYNRINQNGPKKMGWRTTAINLNF